MITSLADSRVEASFASAPGMFPTECTHCGASMQVPVPYHGNDVRCSVCKLEFPALRAEERPFSFDCPQCLGSIQAEASWVGISAPCPHFRSTIVIPNLHAPPQPIPPPPLPPRQQTNRPPSKPPAPEQTSPKPPTETNRKIPAVFVALLIVVAFGYPRLHNNSIREHLKSCETYGVVSADVYYASIFTSDVVVFDLKAGSSSGARRIDPVHLLLQFAAKVDFSSSERVILARDGTQKFYIDASDLKRLASSYDGGGRIWAFNHLPENSRTMSGTSAYGTWTGGWLGVAQKQEADLNSLIEGWTGY